MDRSLVRAVVSVAVVLAVLAIVADASAINPTAKPPASTAPSATTLAKPPASTTAKSPAPTLAPITIEELTDGTP